MCLQQLWFSFRITLFVFEFGQIYVGEQALAKCKLNQGETAEYILIGHLNAVRTLGTYFVHGFLDFNFTSVFQTLNANVDGDESA